MADANPHHTLLSAGADMHLIKNTVQATQANTNTIKAPSAACCTCKSALGQTSSLLYHNWHNLQQFSTTTSTPCDLCSVLFFGTMDMCLCYNSAIGVATALALMAATISVFPVLMIKTDDRHSNPGMGLDPKIIGSLGNVETEHFSHVYRLPDSYIVTKPAVLPCVQCAVLQYILL
jgi:hypothetical protein